MTTKAKTKPRAAEISQAVELSLTIEAGYGLKAVIHDGYLQLEQSDESGKADTLMLSKAEARALFQTFGDWAASC